MRSRGQSRHLVRAVAIITVAVVLTTGLSASGVSPGPAHVDRQGLASFVSVNGAPLFEFPKLTTSPLRVSAGGGTAPVGSSGTLIAVAGHGPVVGSAGCRVTTLVQTWDGVELARDTNVDCRLPLTWDLLQQEAFRHRRSYIGDVLELVSTPSAFGRRMPGVAVAVVAITAR